MTLARKGDLIAHGRTADVYAWQEEQVIKLFHEWVPENWIERELVIGRALSDTPLPVPMLIDRISLEDQRGIIYARVTGPSMLQLLTTRPWRMFSLARQLAELHAMIHARSGAGYYAVRASLAATIARVDVLPARVKSGVLDQLSRLPDGTALCHFDFHPGQVILSPHGPVILDWMSAQQGDPLADVARTMVLLTFSQPAQAGWLMRNLVTLFKGAAVRIYLSRYLQLHPHAGRAEVEAWMIPVAAARLGEDIPGEQQAILAYLARSLSVSINTFA